MVTNAGPNVEVTSGTYTYNDIGVTYTYAFCVSATAGFEFILNDTLVGEALNIMNNKKITSLFVCEKTKPIGIIHIHDLLRLSS